MEFKFLDTAHLPDFPTENGGLDDAFLRAHNLMDENCELIRDLASSTSLFDAPSIRLFNCDPSAPDVVDWVIEFGKAPAGWTPKSAYPSIDCDESVLASALGLTDIKLWYSSVDFEAQSWFAGSNADRLLIRSWAQDIAPDWPTDLGLMRAGVNFTANAMLLDSLDQQVRQHFGLRDNLRVNGAVGVDEDGIFIELEGSISTFEYPMLSGKLKPSLTGLRVRVSGLNETNSLPVLQFSLIGELQVEGNKANVTLDISSNGKMLDLFIETGSPDHSCKGWLASLIPDFELDLSDLATGAKNWIPNLRSFHTRLPMKGKESTSATIELGFNDDLVLFDEMVNLKPSLILRTDFTAKGTEVVLASQWIIGPNDDEAVFDLSITLPSGDAYMALAPGCTLHLPEKITQLLSPLRQDQETLHIAHLELEGSVKDKFFSLEILTMGFLAFKINDSAFEVGDVELTLEIDDGHWYSRLQATLAIGRYTFLLSAHFDKTANFMVEIPSLFLSDLANDLFKIELPAELADAQINAFKMSLSIGTDTQFKFSATSNAVLKIGGAAVHLKSLEVSYTRNPGHSFELNGKAAIKTGQTSADLDLVYQAGTWHLTGDIKTRIDLAALLNDMASEIGFQSPLGQSTVTVSSLYLDIRLGKAGTRLGIRCEVEINDARYSLVLIAAKPIAEHGTTTAWQHFLQLDVPTLDLFKLPLVGGPMKAATHAVRSITQEAGKVDVAAIDDLSLRLSSTCNDVELGTLFKGLDDQVFPAPKKLGGKASVRANLTLIDYKKVIDYPVEKEKPAPSESLAPVPEDKAAKVPVVSTTPATAVTDPEIPTNPSKPVTAPGFTPPVGADRGWWLPLGRNLGPVTFERLGIATDIASVSFMLDASARLGPLKLGLLGLEMKTRIGLPIKPDWGLKGMTVSCTTDALRVSGGLVKRQENDYAGTVMIGFGQVTLSAIGSYCQTPATDKELATTHVAIFTVLDTPLGGPPMFFVTGLAGGIGYNRDWKNVSLAQVANHPMITALENGTVDNSAIDRFEKISSPSRGDHWVAVGVRFTSFKILEGKGLLVLSQGEQTQVNVMAKLDLNFPPAKTAGLSLAPLVHAEILMQAQYHPAVGELKVDGMLAPGSFLLSKDAVISGGFALYCWMQPSQYAGDFVMTLGGYHPGFKIPAHYPRVGRLALNWQVCDQVQIKGEQYFALTPSAVMAGGLLQVDYRSSWGTATFKAQADFIIFFQPFAYAANVKIAVHVEAEIEVWPITLKLALDLAVFMEIWGPPFGALARVSFYGLSKDILIGESKALALPEVSWSDFRGSFLPLANAGERKNEKPEVVGTTTVTDSLITLTARSGLLGKIDPLTNLPLGPDANAEQSAAAHWLVDPGTLEIDLTLCIPTRTLDVDGQTHGPGHEFGIGPMNIAAQDLEVVVTVQTANAGHWVVCPTLTSVAMGLWNPSGRPAPGTLPKDQILTDLLTGALLTLEKTPAAEHAPVVVSDLSEHDKQAFWVRPVHRPVVANPDMSQLNDSIHAPNVATRRMELLRAIAVVDQQVANDLSKRASRDGAIVQASIPVRKTPTLADNAVTTPSRLLVDAPRICRWRIQ
ncbi:DUF6603 domain-containing protein [Pseudomonas caspiana]|uniref:DUF6603 domain-containing protein n=1 Tax=Pseudomonas caspiana TaxID=1451454 RepID=A0A1Y3NZ90_9PSED|nr:DUF6603 domain-containing protein [Pseudomonas caspiana]OUM71561.1 hypothetical protein AUC60_22475 [Pseudomonas caspiana]